MIRLRAQHVRTRLTIWYVSLLAGILALYVAGSSIFLFFNLRRELDRSLIEDIETTEGLLRFAPEGTLVIAGTHTEPGEEPDQGRLVEILSPEGNVLYHSRPLGKRSLGGVPFPGEGKDGYSERSANFLDGTRIRLASRYHMVGTRPVVIRIARSEEPLWGEFQRLVTVLLLGFPVALAVAGLGGFGLAVRALAPLETMARRAEKINAENLSDRLFDPNGKQQFTIDNNSIGETEDVELIAVTSGRYRLQITAAERHAPTGRYDITLIGVGPETDRHKTRVAAAREVALATAANRLGTRDAMLQAIGHYESARLHWRDAGDPVEEARTMYTIASVYSELGNREKALSYATGALPLARASHNDQLLGRVLDCIGYVYNNFSDKKTALDHHMQALPLLQSSGDGAGEAAALNNIGVAYLGTGEKNKALELFDQAMRILRPLQDRRTLAQVASNIGVTYDNLGDYQRALESLQYALALRREMEDRAGEALTLNNIGSAYSGLAEYQKALDTYVAALEIHRANDSRWNMAVNLNNIGWVYAALGDRRQALSSYQESLELSRAIKDPRRIAVAQQHRQHSDGARGLSQGNRTSYGGSVAPQADEGP
jgi:tetratricopeptide (TPR) repeat protein